MAPHGCYPCRGEGEWLTIAVASDSEWDTFRSLLRDTRLDAPEFANAEARRQNQDRLDESVEQWTRGQSAEDVMKKLLAEGIRCDCASLRECALFEKGKR